MATEPILGAFEMAGVQRGHAARSSVLSNYWMLTKPEITLFVYTPLKRRTPLCTLVGAIPGAMPVLIGYVAAAGKLDSPAWLLFAILFLWQFPHFMAIAWMYRDDYARSGYAVLPQGKDKALFMGWQSVIPTLVLMFVTVVPLVSYHASSLPIVGTLLLSLSFLYFAVRLAAVRSNGDTRRLLLVSVVYLPGVLVFQVLARFRGGR